MGFDFAALLTGPIAQTLMASFGVSSTFYILGIFYFLVMIIAAQFIKKPRQNELPKAVIKKASHFSLTGQNMTANTAAIMVGILGLFNGAGFSVIPVYLGDVFGTRELGAIHGYVGPQREW